MICPKCGNENPKLGKFCDHCGAPLKQSKVRTKCSLHPELECIYVCAGCGKELCERCGVQIGKEHCCTTCMSEAKSIIEPKKRIKKIAKRNGSTAGSILLAMALLMLFSAAFAAEEGILINIDTFGILFIVAILLPFVALFITAIQIRPFNTKVKQYPRRIRKLADILIRQEP